MTSKKLVSIIVPVLNEENNIYVFYEAVTGVITPLNKYYDFEFIFTDNHSNDSTFENLSKLRIKDDRVKIYRFSRNYGYQLSILAGYQKSSGDAVIQLDCDLQDPPSLIPTFLDIWENGNDVVYGIRKSRKENIFMNGARKLFYRMINWLSDTEMPLDAGDFRLVSRRIVNEIDRIDDIQPYIRGSIALMGFKQIGVEYERDERKHGASKFSLPDLFNLALDGVLNHSVKPLRVASLIGVVIGIITFVGIIVYFVGKLVYGMDWPPGYASIIILLLLSISINALFVGVIGEYVGRIYKQIKRPARVIIEEHLDG